MVNLASYLTGHFMESLRRLICAIRGHEDYLQFEKNRVYLQCISCGHESPGWTVAPPPTNRLTFSREIADPNPARLHDLRLDAAQAEAFTIL